MQRSMTIMPAILLITSVAHAGLVATQPEMEAILDDHIIVEDFDGLSVHGGTSVQAPNPLSSMTAPASWGIQEGETFSSAGPLYIFGAFLHGDDANRLYTPQQALNIAFDNPQAAVGIEVVYNVHATVTFFHDASVLGVVEVDVSSFAFVGWEDTANGGITNVTLVATTGGAPAFAGINLTMYGIDLSPVACSGDADGSGFIDFEDLNFVLENWGMSVDPGTDGDVNGNGFVNFDDLNEVLAHWGQNCS